jgi:aspartokinase
MYLVQKYGGDYLKNNEDLIKNAELFELLGELKVNLNVVAQQPYQGDTSVVSFSCEHYNITTSEISISATINEADKAQAIVSLAEAFGL